MTKYRLIWSAFVRPIVTHGALGESGCAVYMYRMLECRPVVDVMIGRLGAKSIYPRK